MYMYTSLHGTTWRKTMKGRTWRRRRHQKTMDRPCSQKSFCHKYSLLIKWMVNHGFEGTHLRPHVFEATGRGLMTTKPIHPGEDIVCIPDALLVTTKTVLSSYLGEIIRRLPPPKLSPVEVLCLFLVGERHLADQSKWFPYIQFLPVDFTTPVYFTQSELGLLRQDARIQAIKQRKHVSISYAKLVPLMSQISCVYPGLVSVFTYDAFKWAWSVVKTRSVYYESPTANVLNGDKDHYALAPFLDFLNHSPTAEVEAGHRPKTNSYRIKTQTSYKKYDQVFICYGPHDNTTLLMEYGFIVSGNPHNEVKFTIDDLSRLAVLKKINDTMSKMQCIQDNFSSNLYCSMDGISWALQKSLEILVSKSTDMRYEALIAQNDTENPFFRETMNALLLSKLAQCQNERKQTLSDSFLLRCQDVIIIEEQSILKSALNSKVVN